MALAWSFPCRIAGSFLIMQGWLCHPQSRHIQPAWGLLPPSSHPDGRGCILPARSLSRLQCSGGKLGDWDEVTPERMVPWSLQLPRQPGPLQGWPTAWGAGSCFQETGLKENWLILMKYHHANAELCPPPASYPKTHASTGGVIQGGEGRESLALHTASHQWGDLGARSRPSGSGAHSAQEVGWDTTLASTPGKRTASPHAGHTGGATLNPAAFGAPPKKERQALDHTRAPSPRGSPQPHAAGLVHGKSPEITAVSASAALSQVLGSGISSPPFTPLDPCQHLPTVSQATAPMEMGEERSGRAAKVAMPPAR